MRKINNLDSFSYSGELNKKELKGRFHHNSMKSMNLSQDKIYFFRTSLFTEKSKSIIQRMNLSNKYAIRANDAIQIIISKKKEESLSPLRRKSEKIYISDNKIKSEKTIEIENEKIIDKFDNINGKSINVIDKSNKEKPTNDNQTIKNNNIKPVNKRSNKNIIIINAENNNKIQKKSNQSKTEDKNINNIHNEKNYQKIDNIIINEIKRCKLFDSSSNAINTNNISRSVIGNVIEKKLKQSVITNRYLADANSKTKQKLNQKEQIKICDYNSKIKYKLKVKDNDIKKKENNNIVSFKSINDNSTMKKDLKYIKPISKQTPFQSFSIFDENYYISKYILRHYYAKRNNRYNHKNVISEDKKSLKKYIQIGTHVRNTRNKIISLNDKDNLILSRKGKKI